VCADLAVAAYQRGHYAEMRGWAERAADGTSGAVGAIAATLLTVGDAFGGRPAADLRAIIDATADDELGALAEPAMAIPWGLLALDRLPEGLAAARRIAVAARRGGNGPASIPHELAAVLALGLLGRMAEAEPAADAAEQSARMSGNAQLVQWALWLEAWVSLERGRLDAAPAAATESVELARGLDDSASATVARAVLGAVLVAHGSYSDGRPLIAAYDIDHGWICRWAPVLVESDLALGDLPAARAHAARAAELAPTSGIARAAGDRRGRGHRGGAGGGARSARGRAGAARVRP
jgi:tetratricopeptide (TPR) repeat protein